MSKKEQNRLLGHAAESDGIEEYDNPMPNWWVGLFYLTILWAAAYVAYYHFIARKSYVKALAAQVAEAEARWPKSSQLATVEVTPEAIVATITNGVAAKGMPTWGPILGNEKIGEVAAYIISKR